MLLRFGWIGRIGAGLLCAAATALLAACGGGAVASGTAGVITQAVCAAVPAGRARCHAIVQTNVGMEPSAFLRAPQSLRTIEKLPNALGPADLSAAYGYSTAGGVGQTITLIDAYDNANIESDMAVYRANYGLPPCTSASGCFTKVAQDGSSNYPATNSAWAAEEAVDTQMASAVCPNCKILMVEANSDSLADLAVAVDRAAIMGSTIISNSFGSLEWSGEAALESHWNHPGVVVTASAGDDGGQVEFPAASQYTVAVGGLALTRDASARGYADAVWSGSAGGCSLYITKPVWQHDGGCTRRTVADVSFVSSSDMPVAIYQSACSGTICGWTAYSGTSIGAPAIAALYALAGNAAAQHDAQGLYTAAPSAFHDVMTGSNGSCGTYLCTGLPGYDAPSGLGAPNGLAAF